jgi:hypothetical protein
LAPFDYFDFAHYKFAQGKPLNQHRTKLLNYLEMRTSTSLSPSFCMRSQ